MSTIKKGAVVLNRSLTTQSGKVEADEGFKLVSVFLGTVRDGDDPDPLRRLHNLGFRQMTMFECAVVVSIDRESKMTENFPWRLAFSCLGVVDAVEAAVRFAHKMVADEFARSEPGTPAPYLNSIRVGTIQIGPIAEDGTPYNGRGPAFFAWAKGPVSLDEHLATLQDQAKRLV